MLGASAFATYGDPLTRRESEILARAYRLAEPAVHVDRQRFSLHHPAQRRSKRFRTRAHDPRTRTEKWAPQPPPNARKSRTIPTNTEQMAHPTTPSPNARNTPTPTQ